MEQRPDDAGRRSDGIVLSGPIDQEVSVRQVMKRQRPSAFAGAAVIFTAVALAAGTAVAHEAKTNKRSVAQPVAGQLEESAPFKSMDPAVMMPGAHMGRLMMPRM